MESSTPTFKTCAFEFVRILGRGAFGEVSLAKVVRQDVCLPEPAVAHVALKRVPVLQLSKTGTEKALEEARLLKELASDRNCIMRCFDFRIVSGSSPFLELVLEFAPLGDLSRRIKIQRDESSDGLGLPEAEIVVCGRDIAKGLAFLHSLRPKVFHRDVKPANVVLFPASASSASAVRLHAKLADFGIAKLLESEASFAGAATVVGTPHYFSPELCRGQAYDERADAWALGCVIYEMICLHRPFHKVETNIALLAIKISEGKYDREALTERAKSYNELLILTLTELLATEPGERQRARDALHPLESCLAEVDTASAGVHFAANHALEISPEAADSQPPDGPGGDDTDSWRPASGDGTQCPSNIDTPLEDAMRVLRSAAATLSPHGLRLLGVGQLDQTLVDETTQPPITSEDTATTQRPLLAGEQDDAELTQTPHFLDGTQPLGSPAKTNPMAATSASAAPSEWARPATSQASPDSFLKTQYLDSSGGPCVDQTGAPARQAWGGAVFDSANVAEQSEFEANEEETEAADEQLPPAPSRGGRLFMRPLRRGGRRDSSDLFDGPVIFCFRPDVDDAQDSETKNADGQVHSGPGPTPCSADKTDAPAAEAPSDSQAWLQVVIPGTAGGLFSLTAVE